MAEEWIHVRVALVAAVEQRRRIAIGRADGDGGDEVAALVGWVVELLPSGSVSQIVTISIDGRRATRGPGGSLLSITKPPRRASFFVVDFDYNQPVHP